jgi:Spy/CpxP family protein refolding chaperone
MDHGSTKEVYMKRQLVGAVSMFFIALALAGVAFAASDNDPPAAGPSSPTGPAMGPPSGAWYRAGSAAGAFGPAAHWWAIASYLDLSKEQTDKIGQVRQRYFLDTRDLRYDILQKRLEVRKLYTDPKTSAATLMAKEKELSALREKLANARAQMMVDERSILTPAQIEKFDLMPLRMHRMGQAGMMGSMMGEGMPMGRVGPGMMGPRTW